jgi:diguanylate cyclase (GGDEF)-like protein
LAGDYVLRQFSECLNRGIRSYDFIGRFGGEEFIICLPDTELEDAYLIAERMRQSVEEMVTEYEDLKIKITGSFGVVTSHPGVGEPIDKFIGRVDKAMYEAKALKNRVNQSA